jgi:hypothetical protein
MRLGPSRLIAAFILVAAAMPLTGQEEEPEERFGAPFLLFPVGARATAVGQAAAADGGTSEAAFWNPAGLAYLASTELSVHFANTFVSDNTVLSAYFAVSRLGVIGASAYLVDFGTQRVVTGTGVEVGNISPKNIELIGSYATTIAGQLHIGLNYKLIQLRQDCTGQCAAFPSISGTTHAIDVGAQYAFGKEDRLTLGLVIRHAGFDLQLQNEEQADPLPTRVQIGAVYRLLLPAFSGADQRLDARLLIDLDDQIGKYDSPEPRLGIDVGFEDIVRVRAGYAFLDSQSRGPSVGVGLRFGKIAVDVARVFYVSSSFDEPLHISVRATP